MGDKESDRFPISASIEGMEKTMEDMSRVAGAYFVALKLEGFAQREAFELTKDFLCIWWATTLAQTKGSGSG